MFSKPGRQNLVGDGLVEEQTVFRGYQFYGTWTPLGMDIQAVVLQRELNGGSDRKELTQMSRFRDVALLCSGERGGSGQKRRTPLLDGEKQYRWEEDLLRMKIGTRESYVCQLTRRGEGY